MVPMDEGRNAHGKPRALIPVKHESHGMENSLFNRLQATLLALATVGLVLLAVLNFRQESKFVQPDDGVWWIEVNGGLQANKVIPGSPGQLAGIHKGDLLTAINEVPVSRVSDFEHELYRTGAYLKAEYSITRDGVALDTPVEVIPEPTDRSSYLGLRFIGLIYLAIGIYVLFRRWTAPRALHFYLFCLVSFALNALKYTGEWNFVDKTVFWSNIVAGALQPALFLHFAISFPEERWKDAGRRWLLVALYAPGIALLGLWITAITRWQATGILLLRLNQINYAYIAAFYVLAATLFSISYARANTPLLRQQLKWLYRGAWLAVGPFTLLFAIPFLLDVRMPSLLTKLAGLSLVFLPLTFCWSIIRYRLMDTDLIFKRGVAYTLATVTLVGAYFGIIALSADIVHQRFPEAIREWALLIAVVVTAAVFEPLKRRIQGWVDKAFDRQKYDYRKALIEFGRSLSSETNLDALLNSIVERLPRTLLVSRVALFLTQPAGGLRLAASHGLLSSVSDRKLSLGFLDFDRAAHDHSHIFLENAQQALHLPPEQQRTAALLDLNYYLPCRVQDGAATRTIAVIGLGRTIGGDFLSSEDVELLESLASYIGIALQNASLYARLEVKISEFERLKEFNENIVESINVGILALDLEDRIESWNAQMEAMYAVSRGEASARSLVTSSLTTSSLLSKDSATKPACTTCTSSTSPPRPANSAPSTSPSRRCSRATSLSWAASSWSTTSPSASHLKISSHNLTSSVPSACSPPASRTKSTHRLRSSPRTRRCSPSRCVVTPASVPCSRKLRSRASALPKSQTAC